MMTETEERRLAEAAKAEGNVAFRKQKYGAALERYTEAIASAPRWHVLYVNRAQCYRKLSKWPQVMEDCQTALQLCSGIMKANYFLGMAYRHQLKYSDAVLCLDKALEAAREQNDSVKDDIWREIAACKYAWWQQESQQRRDKRDRLAGRLAAMMDYWHAHHDEAAADHRRDERDLGDVLSDATLRDTVRDTDSAFACPLTMEPLRDPVITAWGQSYERSALREHLAKVGAFDPVTRDPVSEGQVYPNVRLRAATRHYLDEHPWAWQECMEFQTE